MSVKNWVYGGKIPSPQDVVDDAVYAAHKYRNKLCELELAKRERHYELLRRLAPAFVAAEQRIEALERELGECRENIQAERVKQRTKTPKGVKSTSERAAEIKAELKGARAEQKAAKLAAYADPAVQAEIERNTEQHKAECAAAKEASGLYWGTEAVVSQSCRSFASGAPPRYARYDGCGQLAVQVQGGIDCSEATKADTRFYIEGTGKHRAAKVRIGSGPDRSPVFADLPIVMHRELPAGRIKWAFLQRRKRADKERYSLRLSIEVEDQPEAQIPPGEVAIHVGWSMTASGLKVATWLGSDGKSGVLVLSERDLADHDKLAEVRSKRDIAFNEAVENLREWVGDQDVPGWFGEATKNIHAWRSPLRLAILVNKWRDNRFGQDFRIFSELDAWRKKDKHLWQHHSRLSERLQGRRKTIYRTFLARLAKQYGVCIVSPIKAAELNENSEPEDLQADQTAFHRHAKWAAVSTLIQYAKEKWPERCIEVDPNNMSRQCMHCGHVNGKQGREVQCHGCGKTWDIDLNAATVMLARGQAAKESGALLAIVEAKELRARESQERLLKMQDARRKKIAARKSAMETQGETG